VSQSTIARRTSCRGRGLHSGREVGLVLEPAAADSGVVFVLRDGRRAGRRVEIPARVDAVRETTRATTLAQAGDAASDAPRVTTVEHLLAAISAASIDNLRVEIDGDEIPGMDGSAAPFVELLARAGRIRQPAPRALLSVRRSCEVRRGDRWIRAEPASNLRISYAIDFPHPLIGRQTFELSALDQAGFARELAPARTFGFAHEVEALRASGLATGADLDNALVLDDEGVLNATGTRWPDEFVRHKVVDLLGDLVLLGAPLHAHVQVEKGGHGLHHALVRALCETPGLLERSDQIEAA
jgi:UDP-3-O-[3-hydroxymyristoyl] N-acetylglucosamine deacetylase